MEKRLRSNVARRTWNVLRLALLWARKGGVFRRRLAMDLRIVPRFIKSIGHKNTSSLDKMRYSYGERELSFGKTPTYHVKMSRPGGSMRFLLPHIPCINPEVDFDYDFGRDDTGDRNDYGYDDDVRKSFLVGVDDEGYEDFCDDTKLVGLSSNDQEDGEEGIDVRAEEFIEKFYQHLKLQRQISYLQNQ